VWTPNRKRGTEAELLPFAACDPGALQPQDAVYLDSDMLVFGDIAELATLPFDDARVLCTYQSETPAAWTDSNWFHSGRQFSVMVLDCERLDWDVLSIVGGLDVGRYSYSELMFDLCILPESQIAERVPGAWNHLERHGT
jgi:hypothetical protein